jgi:hypothetical protein
VELAVVVHPFVEYVVAIPFWDRFSWVILFDAVK